MTAQAPARTQVSRETNLTITERCADPEFQKFLSRTFRQWWASGERRGLSAKETTDEIVINWCGANERHPEWCGLVAHFERERAQIAEHHRGTK